MSGFKVMFVMVLLRKMLEIHPIVLLFIINIFVLQDRLSIREVIQKCICVILCHLKYNCF